MRCDSADRAGRLGRPAARRHGRRDRRRAHPRRRRHHLRASPRVDESAITGESAPVVREYGGDRSAVTGGTRVLSDRIVVRITSKPGETFVDRMIRLVEGASRQKTPNEIALEHPAGEPDDRLPGRGAHARTRWPRFVGAATSITVLDRAAGLPHPDHDRRAAERDRHRRHGPAGAAQRARDVGPRRRGGRRRDDAAARQDRHDHLRQPPGVRVRAGRRTDVGELARAARLSSLADPTPEGTSVVDLAERDG